MKVTYDAAADALYIQLRPIAPGTADTRQITEDVFADYGPDGRISGIEVLDAAVLLGEEPGRVVMEVASLPPVRPEAA